MNKIGHLPSIMEKMLLIILLSRLTPKLRFSRLNLRLVTSSLFHAGHIMEFWMLPMILPSGQLFSLNT